MLFLFHKDLILDQINSSAKLHNDVLFDEKLILQIEEVATLLIDSFRSDHKLLLAGNGGSAADAQHIAGELVSKFYFERPALSAIALTTDTSILTAIGNDMGYDKIFSRQIEANAKSGDIFLGISTSGNSQNIIEALIKCKEMGVKTVGFTGSNECIMDEICDICIKVPSVIVPRIQEIHILFGHIICSIVEEKLFRKTVV